MKKTIPFRYYIPLIACIPVIIVCVLIIVATLQSNGSSYCYQWLAYGGVFKYKDIKVLGLSIQNALMILGLFVCAGLSSIKSKQYGFTIGGSILATVVFFLFSYLGAKLLAGVERCIDNGWTVWSMEGQSLFGVLYISMVAIPLMALVFKKKVSDLFDFFAPTCPLLLAFIRTGCFLGGCCGPKEMQWGNSPVLLPVQLFEVICDLIILYFCLIQDRPKENGTGKGSGIWPFMMVTYCFTRFLLEFLRYSKLYFGWISLSQTHCIIFFVVGMAWYCYLWEKDAQSKKQHKKIVHKKK